MEKIAIVGSGGLGKELWTLIDAINNKNATYEVIGFYDDAFVEEYEVINGVNCIGKVSDLIDKLPDGTSITFGMANREIVSAIFDSFSRKRNFKYPNLIHPNAQLEYGTVIGIGNTIATGTLLSCHIKLGNFNFFNSMCAVGHDTIIGDYNCFMPRTQISGDVTLGDYNTFSMGSSIVQGKSIGNHNSILANTLLTKSIKNHRKYFGIPAKRLDL
ncbi:hypothetical protein AAU57_12505 [Nonlabens sp. YIK11]|uniref:PglD-related sugar-binding protein n=1 Tax=Nonlabens sp. YIK11 TaxID=1453349 RepID=UPI0006DD078F|nr:hypothetical protein [Nonlabens sp. YIK11]KQC34059.1 hypothetical protein AAU57_12505 [Nonlabens sp. YIK11]